MNILIADLLAAAGPIVAQALNEMPEPVRKRIAEAHADGGWCELRLGLMNAAATVRLMLVDVSGTSIEICKVDHVPQ